MKPNRILSSAVLLLIFSNFAFSQSGWQWLNPKPESNVYCNLNFFDGMKGVAGSSGGTVLLTTDGGLTWKKSLVKIESAIKDVSFIDSNLIVAVTYSSNNIGSILLSDNLGQNWKTFSNNLKSQNYLGMKFINSWTGFILSSSGSILKTNDRCQSWNTYPERYDFNYNSEIIFADNATGFINTQSGVLKTTNSGNTWSKLKNAPGGLTSIYYNGDNLYAVSNNNCYVSSNFGHNWASKELSFTSNISSKIRAYGDMLFLFFNNVIYKSIDNGTSWTSVLVENEYEASFVDGEFINDKLILAGNSLYSFIPQSGAFQPLLPGIRNNIKAGKSVNVNTSFAVGNKGLLMKTIDGGTTWNKINLNTKANLSSIVIKGNHIHIAGDSGVYIYSNDLGSTWTKSRLIFQSRNNNIHSINFLNELSGIICAEGGQLKTTTDGGRIWFDKSASQVNGIFKYINNNLIAGVSDLFYKSSNNGNNWVSFPMDNGRNFYDINFLNENIGFIASDSGTIYKTTNGGLSWNKKIVDNNNTPNIKLNKIVFVNAQTGYCAGNNGRFYYTKTGGESWVQQMFYSASNISDIEILNWRACMIYGDNGLVMKNENVTDAESISISGKVFYKDNGKPVTSGHVKALNFDYNSGITTLFDSSNISSDGSYFLANVRADSSYIVAYPNSELVHDFIPTYYPSSIMWMQAVLLYPTTNLENINIDAHRIVATEGSASITGNVFYTFLSNPVPDVTIAAKLNNSFSKMDYSTVQGTYTLNQLSSGNYKIYFDKLGYKNDSIYVSLTQHQNVTVNINLNNAITSLTGTLVPTEYMLYQNYPNPFNPVTKIEFDLPELSFVKLAVYDILGREVSVLINKELTRGKYAYSWNAINTPSGIYFCRMQTEGYSSVKKMLLLK
ncbi:MAG TPA: YCF48-related protein [Ignavibacteria bacterium]|nr:YCF48-related protein [Ignavibacteria bacterium]